MSYPKGVPREARQPYRLRVLDFIRQWQEFHGQWQSPTQMQIAAGTGITSHGTVWRALKLLEEEGYIKRVRTQVKILRHRRSPKCSS